MSDPFSPPLDDIDRQIRMSELPWVGYARAVLLFLGWSYFLLGLSLPVLYGGMGYVDPEIGPEGAPFMAVAGLCLGMFVWLFAAPMIAGAWGLKRGKKWAWFIAVITGGIMAPSACFPFGVLLLFAMLQEDVRKAFLD